MRIFIVTLALLFCSCEALPFVGAALFEGGKLIYGSIENKKQDERIEKIEQKVEELEDGLD